MRLMIAALMLASPLAAEELGEITFSDMQAPAAPIEGAPVGVDRIRAVGDPLDNCQAPGARRGPRRHASLEVRQAPAPEGSPAPMTFTTQEEESMIVQAARRRGRRGAIPDRPRHSGRRQLGPGRGGSLRAIAATELPDFQDDLDAASAALGARRTAAYWAARPQGQRVSLGSKSYTAGQLAESLNALAELFERKLPSAELRRELTERFDLYQSIGPGPQRDGKVTGYFAPDIPIRETPGGWKVPILRAPESTVSLSRREIDEGGLHGRGLELFWTEHPADLLSLQIEGSGWGILPDGRRQLLSSTAANTYSFRSVAHALFDCGVTDQLLGPIALAAYLKSQTFEREQKMVDLDPRYVFFRAGEGGPRGEAGIELIAGRSIAIDPSQVPMAQAGLLISKRPIVGPNGDVTDERDFGRFIFTHDTGDAIRGPARVDLFWGDGPDAEVEASHMMQPGRLFFFVLKSAPGARS